MEEDRHYDLIASLNFSASQWKFTGSSRQCFTNEVSTNWLRMASHANRAIWKGPHMIDKSSKAKLKKELGYQWAVLTSLIRFINLGPRRHGLWRWHCRELTVSWEARWEAMATMYTASYIRAASVCGGKHPQFQSTFTYSFTCVVTLPLSSFLICLISTDIYSPAEQFSLSNSSFSLK